MEGIASFVPNFPPIIPFKKLASKVVRLQLTRSKGYSCFPGRLNNSRGEGGGKKEGAGRRGVGSEERLWRRGAPRRAVNHVDWRFEPTANNNLLEITDNRTRRPRPIMNQGKHSANYRFRPSTFFHPQLTIFHPASFNGAFIFLQFFVFLFSFFFWFGFDLIWLDSMRRDERCIYRIWRNNFSRKYQTFETMAMACCGRGRRFTAGLSLVLSRLSYNYELIPVNIDDNSRRDSIELRNNGDN